MALLQRDEEKDKELLRRKDKELHHQRRPSPVPSHSQGDERGVGDKNQKKDRRSPPPYGEQEKTPLRDKTVSPPPHKSKREELDGERLKGPIHHSQVHATPYVTNEDVMSKALHQISQSPFSEDIEKTNLPKRFTRPTFIIYDGKMDPVEHVSHYNQSMTIYSKNKALMYKIFHSSLGPITMRWFDGLEKKGYLRL